MSLNQIIAAVGPIGLGVLLKSFIDFLIASRKAKQDARNNFKEVRYKSILLLCFTLVYYDKEGIMLTINRPDLNSFDRLKNELHVEFINMSLFASDNVIHKMKEFIIQQNDKTLNILALQMRKDLYGIKTKLKGNDFDISIL